MTPEFTNKDVLNLLRKRMEEEQLNQRELAKKIGISPAYLNDMFWERRSVTNQIANYLGLEKVTIFRPKR